MKALFGTAIACTLLGGALSPARAADQDQTAKTLIEQAATALGGTDRVRGARTLAIFGYGQMAYQDGGGNIASSPDAPQKWVNINDYRRVTDLEHGRSNVQQQNVQDFVFAYRRNMVGEVRINATVDGDVAFNPDPSGKLVRAPAMAARNRRIDMLDNPLSIVRLALDPATRLGKPHAAGGLQVIDVTTPQGDRVVLAIDAATICPRGQLGGAARQFRRRDLSHPLYRLPARGRRRADLPSGYNTISDFRNVPQQKLYVDKYVVNGPIRIWPHRPRSAPTCRLRAGRMWTRYPWPRACGS